ncbi:MAG TPA: Flp family type IVb pilin [Micavibrio sp.]
MLTKIIAHVQAYVKSEEGATAIEYGLIAGGISLAIMAAVFVAGDSLGGMFGSISTALSTAATDVDAVATGGGATP